MKLDKDQASRLADRYVDDIIEYLEDRMSFTFDEEQWEQLHDELGFELEHALANLELPDA